MMRTRIEVYTDPETKLRVQMAAAQYGISVTEYCFEAIEQRLADDELIEREQSEAIGLGTSDPSLIADLRALRERILKDRGGQLIDLDTILTDLQEERERDLIGLR